MPASAPTLTATRSPAAHRLSLLAVVQASSVDVVAGVVCAAAFAASAAGAQMPLAWWIALPAATFVVYAVDHLLDVRDGRWIQSARRRWHRRHGPALAVHAAIVALVALAAALLLPRSLWPGGAVLAAAALVHLGLAQRGGERFPKEVSAGAIYTAAIWYGPLQSGARVDGWVALLVLAHFIAALANLGVFAMFERAADAADGQASTVHRWGTERMRRWMRVVTLLGVACSTAVLVAGPARLGVHAVVVTALVLTPVALDAARDRVARGDAYRTWGDLAFLLLLLPAVLA